MDLFNQDRHQNVLPNDGTVHYLGMILNQDQANHYLQNLLREVPWKNDEAIIYGKHIITKRKVAWYGDKDFAYTYSNTTRFALPWTKSLFELKTKVETITQQKFNSCLLNLYHDGGEGMAWHSDDEEALGKNTTIASLSLGAERKFSFKHKRTKQTVSLVLENSGLLVMKDETQTHWLHSLPKTTKVMRPRVNLTFRTFLQ
ncbi:MAG: alpha-ketoglutarate-dependent dioxygenase AlkB [Cytophagales bacterium]|nr:alpha-ketoglutarate-dependent dioxygenase AlkB [Cytophagales bacterium]